jgi:hypothetical protein
MEGAMDSSRRSFLGSALILAAAVAARAEQGAAPVPTTTLPEDPFNPPPSPDRPHFSPRDMLAANQKGIRKDVAQLSDIIEKLQKQLADNDIKDVLPLDVIRETDEIQKLAKHINSLVRG